MQPAAVRVRTWGGLVGAVVVAGVLVAAGVVPWVLVADAAGQAVGDRQGPLSADTVAEVTDQPLPAATQVLAADGSLITDFYDRDRVPVAADAIALGKEAAERAIEPIREAMRTLA